VRGLEFEFRQNLKFLPGALKGLGVRANYTYLETEGNFGGTADIGKNNLAGFIPRAYNVGLTYTYGKWGASYDINYTGRWPVLNVNTTSPVGNRFREPWTIMNAGISYRVLPEATLFANVSNLAEEGRQEYIFSPSRVRSEWVIPRSLKFGVTGRF
jgi:outer membrane receptor protein involved in Fe transport